VAPPLQFEAVARKDGTGSAQRGGPFLV